MKNIVCSWQGPRCPPWAPRGGEILRGGGQGGKNTFSFSSSEPVGGFQSNSVGIILRGLEPKVVHVEHVASRGPRGRVPQGEIGEIYVPNHKSLQSRYVVHGCLYR